MRDRVITVRLTPEQYKLVYNCATERDLEISQVIRMLVDSLESDPKKIKEELEFHKKIMQKKRQKLHEIEAKIAKNKQKMSKNEQKTAQNRAVSKVKKPLWRALARTFEPGKLHKKQRIEEWIKENTKTIDSSIREAVIQELIRAAERLLL